MQPPVHVLGQRGRRERHRDGDDRETNTLVQHDPNYTKDHIETHLKGGFSASSEGEMTDSQGA